MASLHKHPRSPFYYCAYTLEDGTRRFRSTKKRIKGEAMQVCVQWAGAVREAGANHRDLEILNEMRKARGKQELNLQRIGEYFENWLEGRKLHISPATWTRYNTSIQKFLGFLGDRVKDDLRNLSAEQIEEFRKSEQQAGLASATLNMDLKAIRSALGLAKRRGYLQINMASTIEAEQGEKAERQAFTLEQIQKLLQVADDEWYGLIHVGYFTGLRLGDASTLTWGQVDIQQKTITCYPQKRRRKSAKPAHVEPIHKHLLVWFKGWKSEHAAVGAADPVFPVLSKKSVHRRNGLSNTFTRMIDAAKIPNPIVRQKGKGKRGRSTPALSFHSLRHSFNTQLEAAGVSEEVRMRLSDHSTPSINRGYTKPEHERLEKEINKLKPLAS
ncbi:MAG: tyrosine-type recombinase/integrase [Verrucomicrobia bacterium]|nr:tyrosine-type recombinase/integrase [Verrucomicrobiota bacterium]